MVTDTDRRESQKAEVNAEVTAFYFCILISYF